jgi:hypothetical protein
LNRGFSCPLNLIERVDAWAGQAMHYHTIMVWLCFLPE